MELFKKTFVIAAATLSFSALAALGHNETVDRDGCWDGYHSFINGGDKCMQVSTTNWVNDEKLQVVYKNTCSHRVYAKFCNARTNGSKDCGTDGIRPHGTKSWSTYNASGRYLYMAVGSDISNKDWVCARRVAGDAWYDME